MNHYLLLRVLSLFLAWRGVAVMHTPDRANIAADIASTDADEREADILTSIALHESDGHWNAIGDGGAAHGAWQVHGDPSAAEALRRLRHSEAVCGRWDLTLYAGCGTCGSCPETVASLLDPMRPRR